MRAGSVMADVNFLPAPPHLDPRPPAALVRLLQSLANDNTSLLHVAATTRKVASVSEAPFHETAVRSAASIASEEQMPEMFASPRSRRASMPQSSHCLVEGLMDEFVERVHELRLLTKQERSAAALNALADGVLRSRDTTIMNIPAVVSLAFEPWEYGEEPEPEDWELQRHQIAYDIAVSLFLPVQCVFVGGEEPRGSGLDVILYPAWEEQSNEGRQGFLRLTQKLHPGVQHRLAGQVRRFFLHCDSHSYCHPLVRISAV